MNKGIRTAALLLAATGLVVASTAGCGSSSGSGGSQQPPAKQSCAAGDNDYSWCSNQPGEKVSANPEPTNPGVGHVSGACRFSIQGPPADTTGGSGLKTKRASSVLIIVAGIVWGYCTDTIHDFTIDMHVYAAPAGTASGDFTKDPNAHEVGHSENHNAPGPIPTPYAVTAPCVAGLDYQLVWYITATDDASNFIGGGPYGGRITSFTAAQCGHA